ncbi:hypothetical protein GJ744_006267 [Endocarpon pusillum]|uniref:Uncharacterized protein n=1 Tax=Endocarpon pusillum TaxID=364733 RepID=A0A8H7E6W9_9EURO|nr:hypothetical protein GJ744_006267 [Endocarpon pusillum]
MAVQATDLTPVGIWSPCKRQTSVKTRAETVPGYQPSQQNPAYPSTSAGPSNAPKRHPPSPSTTAYYRAQYSFVLAFWSQHSTTITAHSGRGPSPLPWAGLARGSVRPNTVRAGSRRALDAASGVGVIRWGRAWTNDPLEFAPSRR